MPRAYTVATAAVALQVPAKWIDNTLSHYNVQGVSQARQGVSRRLTIQSLSILSIALKLIHELALPVERALIISTRLLAADGSLSFAEGLKVEINVEQNMAQLLERLEHAVEVAPLPRRGRPPEKTTGRLD